MLLEVKNLQFSYPNSERNALDGISFSVNDGDFVVVCGSSGCGKSTLIKSIKPELAPFGKRTGEILYDGIDVCELSLRKGASEIGFVMQNPQTQVVTDKVWHELAFGLENLGLSTDVIRVRVSEMASFFGIADWFNKKTSELSGGQLQLLNLASVMAMQPRLLLLDEPTSQLDPITATEFIETLKKLNRDTGLTIVLVEHRLEDVFAIADSVIVLDKGKVLLQNEPKYICEGVSNDYPEVMMSFPTAMRVHSALVGSGESPLTARDGRRFLSQNFGNRIRSLPSKPTSIDSKMIVYELRDVWFRYERNSVDVLKGISLSAHRGEILSIVGANGAGKTTLLSVMSRTLTPYKGKIKLSGKSLSSYKAEELYHNNLAILPQNPQTVFVGDTVFEDLNDINQIMGYNDDSKVNEIVDLLNIRALLLSHPYDLSGGEQQKVALAKILLLNPQVILLDEPTKGIDAYAKSVLAGILRGLTAKGATIIIVTHDIEFSASISDRCAMFFNGEIISVGDMTEFYSGNSFYTTVANRMSRHMYDNAITCEDVIKLCKLNA